jgi:hypothetical protein
VTQRYSGQGRSCLCRGRKDKGARRRTIALEEFPLSRICRWPTNPPAFAPLRTRKGAFGSTPASSQAQEKRSEPWFFIAKGKKKSPLCAVGVIVYRCVSVGTLSATPRRYGSAAPHDILVCYNYQKSNAPAGISFQPSTKYTICGLGLQAQRDGGVKLS